MTRWIGSAMVWIAALLLQPHAFAQQPVAAEPIVQVTADPARVVVGQPVTLRIVVLAPNYMTSPPELPDFQVRNAVTRQLQSVNTNEQRDGVSYAGVQYEYAISPQEPGTYAIADQSVSIKYAAAPPATRELSVALPRVSFEAFIPDAAAALRPFVSAQKLVAEQQIKRSSDPLKAGDAITPTVTITAEGTPAMLLPPLQFSAVDGLRLYPAQPQLEDKTQARTDVMTATRIESATYMVERSGTYALPAIEIGWWNVAGGKVERIHLDGVAFTVAATPGMTGERPVGQSGRNWTWAGIRDVLADHWLIVLLAAIIAVGLGLIAPRVIRRASADHRRRRDAYRRSEAFAFHQLRRAIGRRDASRAYFALLDWLPHLKAAPDSTAAAFRAAAGDPVLDAQIEALERTLFCKGRNATPWSPNEMMRHLTTARRNLRPRERHGRSRGLPLSINPAGPSSIPAHDRRRPAR
ncbi:BatD family protein [Bradyrhizobium sp. CCGUVB4N]|uniref:BatD family protein n=1 Tax=Bradyrhizobium sp. CCGUVB4N TaxID=2949631 RepID=UPI0020B1CF50|nr:BatD family protein [Bradyrhizobium sp. CCGUVB4N]MCP3382980.1 BatD family protein [Bradyrhizobium sp. CCGUVB4N]